MTGTLTWKAPTAPPPAPEPLVGEDRPMLEAFLAEQRRTLLNICAGLTAAQLSEPASPPSNLTLLGLVRHMAKVERVWFRERVAGETMAPMHDPALGRDADFEDLDPTRASEDFDRFVEECRRADATAAGLEFDHTFELRGQTYSLRLVYVHMVAEYARHNGHADLLRQRIDGVTGR